jgi:PAS domain S-box-containing protein
MIMRPRSVGDFLRARSLRLLVISAGSLMLLFVAGCFALVITAIRSQQSAASVAQRSVQVRAEANRLERFLVDIEASEQAFLLSRRKRDLAPARQAIAGYPQTVSRLQRLIQYPPQRVRLRGIDRAIGRYVETWHAPLVALARRHPAAARARFASEKGKRQIDALQVRFDRFGAHQDALTAERTRRSVRQAAVSRTAASAAVALATLLIVGLVFLLLRSVVRPIRRLGHAARRISDGESTDLIAAHGVSDLVELALDLNAMARTLAHGRTTIERKEADTTAALRDLDLEKRRLETLYRFGTELAAETDVAALARAVLRHVGAIVPVDFGVVYVAGVDEEENWQVYATHGLPVESVPRTLSPKDGGAPNTTAILDGVRADVAHELSVPLERGGRRVGLLELARSANEPFAPEDRSLVERMADQAAVALSSALSLRGALDLAATQRALLDASRDGIALVDPAGRPVFTTASMGTIGLSGMFVGKQAIWEHFAALAPQLADPDAFREVVARLRERPELAESFDFELTASKRTFSCYSAPVHGGDGRLLGRIFTRRETTEERRLLQSAVDSDRLARAQAARLAAVLRAATEYSIIATDLDGSIELFNDGAARLLGYAAEDVVGVLKPIAFHDPAEVSARAAELGIPAGFDVLVAAARRGEAETREWTYVRRDGSPVPVSLTVTALHDDAGRLSGFIGIAVDVSERKRLETLRQGFVSTVSHELRTPLTSIVGFVELLRDGVAGELSSEQLEFVDVVERGAGRLRALVDDLLLTGQIDSGRLVLDRAPVDLDVLVADLVAEARPAAETCKVELHAHLRPGTTVLADSLRVHQVVENLLTNALKFTPPGGRVHVVVAEEDRRGVLEVHDTGIGIPAEERPRMFERFFRASSVVSADTQGTGLGLSICRSIVDAHGGTIALVERPGPGATFRVELPLAAAVPARG